MGLFSGLRGRGADATLNVSTAVMIPIVAAMMADGVYDNDEISQIRSICAWSPIYANNSRDEDTQIILRAIRLVEDHSAQEMCGRAAEVLSSPLRETAFAFAARVLFADGHIGRDEERFLESLVHQLQLDHQRGRQILEVISIMQHDASA